MGLQFGYVKIIVLSACSILRTHPDIISYAMGLVDFDQ